MINLSQESKDIQTLRKITRVLSENAKELMAIGKRYKLEELTTHYTLVFSEFIETLADKAFITSIEKEREKK